MPTTKRSRGGTVDTLTERTPPARRRLHDSGAHVNKHCCLDYCCHPCRCCRCCCWCYCLNCCRRSASEQLSRWPMAVAYVTGSQSKHKPELDSLGERPVSWPGARPALAAVGWLGKRLFRTRSGVQCRPAAELDHRAHHVRPRQCN